MGLRTRLGLKKAWRHTQRSFANAWTAFHPGEISYKLAIGEFGGFKVAFRQGTADERVIRHSFDDDIFFTGVPQYQPNETDVILDIGAHIGTFSLLAASKTPLGVVHAIEASQETFNYLRINAALNPTLPIVAHHLALTDRDGEVTLHHDHENWGHSIMRPLSKYGETVGASSLASFVAATGIDRIDFIKFNCEGAEFPILMGAPDELLGRVRKMLILYHTFLARDSDLPALLDRLEKVGFSTTITNRERKSGWIIAERPD